MPDKGKKELESELRELESEMNQLRTQSELIDIQKRHCAAKIIELRQKLSGTETIREKYQVDPLTKSIKELTLSKRTIQVLTDAGITSIGILISAAEAELLALNNSSAKTVQEIKAALIAKNLPALVLRRTAQ